MNETLVEFCLRIKNQLEVLHWQTGSYARHMAYGATYEAIGDFIDALMESYQGKYGRVRIENPIVIKNIDDDTVGIFADETIELLVSWVPTFFEDNDNDLLNIRDEILAQFSKLKFLISLN